MKSSESTLVALALPVGRGSREPPRSQHGRPAASAARRPWCRRGALPARTAQPEESSDFAVVGRPRTGVGWFERRGLNARRDEMSVADLHELEEVRGLIARGMQLGVLTHAEIATASAEVGLEETRRRGVARPVGALRDRVGRGDRPSHGEPRHRARAREAHSRQGSAGSQAG
jgi:hypothetical protein